MADRDLSPDRPTCELKTTTGRSIDVFGQVFHSGFDSKARGVAIVSGKTVHFSISTVISDKHGRYLIITGKLWHTPVILVNVYAPNSDNTAFANSLLSKIPCLNNHLLIFGGDCNCVIDLSLDCSTSNMRSPFAMTKCFSDLKNWKFCEAISASINDFLTFIKQASPPTSSYGIQLRPNLRGQIISYSSYLNKIHKAKLDELSKAILELDHQCAFSPSPALYKQQLNLQSEFNLLSTRDAEHLLLSLRGTLYKHCNRTGQLLAHRLKCLAASPLIPKILDSSNNSICDPSDINDTFHIFL